MGVRLNLPGLLPLTGGGGGLLLSDYSRRVPQQRMDSQMIRGDLSNHPTRKVMLVFEGALGILADKDKAKYDRALKRKRYDEAIRFYVLDDLMVRRIQWLIFHQSLRVDVVTFLGDDMAGALDQYLEDEEVPTKVWSSTPARLARRSSYLTELSAIYDPEPSRQFAYGGKGHTILSPNDLGR